MTAATYDPATDPFAILEGEEPLPPLWTGPRRMFDLENKFAQDRLDRANSASLAATAPPVMAELEATNIMADAALLNELLAVRARNGDVCYFMGTLAAAPDPTSDELAVVERGCRAAYEELGIAELTPADEIEIVRAIARDNEVRDRCYED